MKNHTEFVKDIRHTEYHFRNNETLPAVIIHLFEESFCDINKFKLFLGLIKLKICIPQKAKIVVIYDNDLSDNNIAQFENLISKLNFSNNIIIEEAKKILSKIDLEDVFLKLSCIPLYNLKEDSFYKMAKLALLQIESEMYNGIHIQFSNYIDLPEALKHSVGSENVEILYFKALSALLEMEHELFGTVMAASDFQMKAIYQCLYSDSIPAHITKQIENEPFEMKKALATFLVSFTFNNETIGNKCREQFEEIFCKRKYTDADFVLIKVDEVCSLFDALFNANKFKSKSELNRLFKQNAVKNMTGQVMIPKDKAYTCGKIRIGKHLFFNLVKNDE